MYDRSNGGRKKGEKTEQETEGLGEGSVRKALAMKTWSPEFDVQNWCKSIRKKRWHTLASTCVHSYTQDTHTHIILEEVCHRKGFKSLKTTPFLALSHLAIVMWARSQSLLQPLCLLPAASTPPSQTLALWNHAPKQTFPSGSCLGHGVCQSNQKGTETATNVGTAAQHARVLSWC